MGKKNKKSKEPKNVKPLEHETVLLNTVYRRTSVHNTILSWRILKYHELKPNVLYFREFDMKEGKCVLKLFKTQKALNLCLRCQQLVHKKAQFYLVHETQPSYLSDPAEEILGGLYIGSFKFEQFEDSELSYILDGMLTVSFRYVSDTVVDEGEKEFDDTDIHPDLEELCCDLRIMYLESMYPDFEINVRDYVFNAHKFVLCARCEFFREFFDKNPEATEFTIDTTIDVAPGILHEVLLFVYCGVLKEMDLNCMKAVDKLANHLKIPPLLEICLIYFNSSSESNLAMKEENIQS